MKLLLSVHVTVLTPCTVHNGEKGIVMLPFTGYADGDYFQGDIAGTGVDTQRIQGDRLVGLSARYMLKGRDYTGRECSIFIENNGDSLEHCIPFLVTDSEALAGWQRASLISRVTPTENGVLVCIYETEDGGR